MGQSRRFSPGHNRTHIGVCLLVTNRRAALARLLFDGSATLDAKLLTGGASAPVSRPRTPCMGSFGVGAGRCSRPRQSIGRGGGGRAEAGPAQLDGVQSGAGCRRGAPRQARQGRRRQHVETLQPLMICLQAFFFFRGLNKRQLQLSSFIRVPHRRGIQSNSDE